jgi:WD40 repeat protein
VISRPVRYFAVCVAVVLAACTGQPAPATLPAGPTPTAPVAATTAAGVFTATAPAAPTRAPSPTGTRTPEATPTRPPANTPTATGSPTLPAVQLSLLHEWRSPPIAHLAWSPDGSSLAVASTDGITLYDPATLHEQRFLDTQAPVLRVAYSADGRLLAAATQEKLQIWEVQSGQQRNAFPAGQPAALAFSPDGRLLADTFLGQMLVYEVDTGQQLWVDQEPTYLGAENTQAVAFSPDGHYLAADSAGGMWVWDAASGELLRRLEAPPTFVRSLAFSADSRVLVAAGGSQLAYWNVDAGQRQQAVDIGVSSAVVLAPDLSWVAGTGDGVIELRDTRTGAHHLWLTGHTGYATALAFSADGRRLAAVDGNATVWIWDTHTGQVLATLDRYAPGVRHLAFSPDGQALVWASGYRVWRWDANAESAPGPAFTLPLPVSVLAFSPDGRLLAAGSQQPLVRRPAFAAGSQVAVWDFASGQLAHTFAGHGDAVYALAFSPDGHWLASGGLDTLIRLTDVNRATATRVLVGGHTSVVDLAFSPDGQTLYSLAAAYEGCNESCGTQPGVIQARDEPQPLRLWQTATGQPGPVPAGQPDQPVFSLAVSPDGTLLAGHTGQGLLVRDARTGEALRQITTFGPRITVYVPQITTFAPPGAVRFSPDGRYLITTNDHAVLFFEAQSGRLVSTIETQAPSITSLAISADGSQLATSSGDGVVRIWQITVDGR